MQKNQQYALLALMLLGLALFHLIQLKLWEWIAHDLSDGAWACALALRIGDGQTSALVGIEGRFLWTASLILLLLSMALLLIVSVHSLAQRLPRWRQATRIGLGLGLGGLVIGVIASTPSDHQQFMQMAQGTACGFTEKPVFHFSRYLLLLFQPHYQPLTLDALSYTEQLLPALLLPCNLLLTLALVATVWLKNPADGTLPDLAARMARYRLLLLAASALFTALSLYHMSEFRWFGQVMAASDGDGAGLLSSLQRGLTLYLGTTNTLALAIFFLPTGWLLAQQASALAAREPGLDTLDAREDWLGLHQLKLYSGPLMQIGAVLAPMLVSGGMTLLQQGLNG